ncbi:MAG TPA: hypothetical protein DEB74_00915 [Lachnospiraceae bacterium]|nr:hypothetical protein [Lachnospiraceae bacterium]
MKRKITALLLALSLSFVMPSTIFASETLDDSGSGTLQAFHKESQEEISGYESDKLTRGYAVGTCFTGADIEKKFLAKEWRGSGEVTIVGDVTWDITINCEFYKDGSYYTGNDETAYDTNHAYVVTKYVSGSKESQFGVHCQFTVKDDNNVKIHDSQLSAGNPFD